MLRQPVESLPVGAIEGFVGSIRRPLTLVILVCLVVLGAAQPASADPATPTNYRSTVTAVGPEASGVVFEITGGDAFLSVSVETGHTVLIPGYFGEPYVRIDPDRSVWVNKSSRAFYINQDRYGEVAPPKDLDPNAPPAWAQVGDDGRYAWHDHRSHWMSHDPPPAISGDVLETVFPWELPVVIDGVDTTVRGELVWVPSRSPWGPVLAGMVALLPFAVWGTQHHLARGLVIAAGSAAAIGVEIALIIGTPAPARGLWAEAILPLVAVGALGFVARYRDSRTGVSTLSTLVAGVVLLVWGASNVATLWMPLLPTSLPTAAERVMVGIAIWAGMGLCAVTVPSIFTTAKPEYSAFFAFSQAS